MYFKFDKSLSVFDIETLLGLIHAVNYKSDGELLIHSISREDKSYSLLGSFPDGSKVRYQFSLGKSIKGVRILQKGDKTEQSDYLITKLFSREEESFLLVLKDGEAQSVIQTEERLFLEYQFPHVFKTAPVDQLHLLIDSKIKVK